MIIPYKDQEQKERRIAALVLYANGMTIDEVAAELNTSRRVISNDLRAMMLRNKVRHKAALCCLAMRHNKIPYNEQQKLTAAQQ